MPRPRRATAESRSGVSLDLAANRNPETNKRRVACFEGFCNWVKIELSLDVSEDVFAPHHMSMALIGYGKHLFYAGAPKYQFAETINAVIGRFPTYRGLVAAAWGTLKKWEEAEPTERAMVMPAAVFKAAVSLSLLWSWPRFAAALISGFHGLLRPAEFIPLKRGGLILPMDILSSAAICYVRILHSKTSRFMPRQHARISDSASVQYLQGLFGHFGKHEFLFGCSFAVFRTRWNRLFEALGIPTAENQRGVTPKSLRGSGASWLFHHTEDVSKLLWRGQWQSRRTLEHYLQDVMGQVLLSDLSISQRDAILELSYASFFWLVKAVRYTSVHPRGSELDVVTNVTYPLSSWCCAGTAFSTFGSWDPSCG